LVAVRNLVRQSRRTAAVVLLVGLGLFAMHLLVPATARTSMGAVHAVMEHGSAVHRAAEAAIDAPSKWTTEHSHELLGCLWLVLGAFALAVVCLAIRLGPEHGERPSSRWWSRRSSQRAPPLTTRLALVGVLRR
jgi:hypothetical protein